MPFTLPDLPFAKDALAPHMSAETLEFHHGKHHKAYVDKTNELLADEAALDGRVADRGDPRRQARRRHEAVQQRAQIWNHSFFWQCLAPAQGPEARRQAARS